MSIESQNLRYLILSTIARNVSISTDTLVAETGLDRKVLTSNLNACIHIARPLVARSSERHPASDRLLVVNQLTDEGKKWVENAKQAIEMNKSIKATSTEKPKKAPRKTSTAAADQAADDKPGVSVTTPEAAIAEGQPSLSEGAARHETPSTTGATSHALAVEGDGLDAGKTEQAKMREYLEHVENTCLARIRESLRDFYVEGTGHVALDEMVEALAQDHARALADGEQDRKAMSTQQELLDKAYEEIGQITPIAEAYSNGSEPLHATVRTMDMLIDAQDALLDAYRRQEDVVNRLIGALGINAMREVTGGRVDALELLEAEVLRISSQAVEDDRQIEATYDVLAPLFPANDPRDPSNLGLCVVAKAVVESMTCMPQPIDIGTYVISAGYQVCEGLEEANEAAVQLALASTTGTVVIARPVQVAEVRPSILPWEHTQCAAATAHSNN